MALKSNVSRSKSAQGKNSLGLKSGRRRSSHHGRSSKSKIQPSIQTASAAKAKSDGDGSQTWIYIAGGICLIVVIVALIVAGVAAASQRSNATDDPSGATNGTTASSRPGQSSSPPPSSPTPSQPIVSSSPTQKWDMRWTSSSNRLTTTTSLSEQIPEADWGKASFTFRLYFANAPGFTSFNETWEDTVKYSDGSLIFNSHSPGEYHAIPIPVDPQSSGFSLLVSGSLMWDTYEGGSAGSNAMDKPVEFNSNNALKELRSSGWSFSIFLLNLSLS